MAHFETSILMKISFVVQFGALVLGQNSSGIDCDSLFGQTELFFEPVSSANYSISELDWTFDDDNASSTVGGYVNYQDTEFCYDEECLTIYQEDYDGDEFEPMLISPPVNTSSYWQINIIYSVVVSTDNNATICSSSYSVGGVIQQSSWTVIQQSYRDPLNASTTKQIVAAPLPEDASDVQDLFIALSVSSRVAKESVDYCDFDEIRICGTPITATPTSAPTTEPSNMPTTEPSNMPTTEPSNMPTTEPSNMPTTEPSNMPTTEPSNMPTTEPSNMPTTEPSTYAQSTAISTAETSTTEVAAQTDTSHTTDTTVEADKSERKAILNMNIAVAVVCAAIYNI